jgi:glycosyltransferase involved in cell wall biosynthesis
MPVINNGVDLLRFMPFAVKKPQKRPVIIHGTTTANKGLDHIDHLKKNLDADVLLLDDAADFFKVPKYPALALADLVVHPSAHEGNSYFVLETLASGVPIVSYDVGLMYLARLENAPVGYIIPRIDRDKHATLDMIKAALDDKKRSDLKPRDWVSQFSVENFRKNWLDYLFREFGYDPFQG